MSDGARCHYCRRAPCQCPDDPKAASLTGPGWEKRLAEIEAAESWDTAELAAAVRELHRRLAERAEALEAAIAAAKAQQTMRRTANPMKLDDAISWRENDELADKMLADAIARAEVKP